MASQWTITNLVNSNTKLLDFCGYYGLGGPGITNAPTYYEKTYTDLPSHNTLAIVVYSYVWDSWKLTDYVSVNIDGHLAQTYYPGRLKTSQYTTNPCGHSLMQFRIVGNVSHSASTLTLRFAMSVDGSTASFGINDINIKLFDSDTTSTNLCATYGLSWNDANSGYTCPCNWNAYLDSTGACVQNCNSNCYHCYGPAASQCYQCLSIGNNIILKDGQCESNSVCSANCNYCDAGKCLLCASNYFLKWDYTCSATCPTGYTASTLGAYYECHTPCEATDTYMLADLTCTDTCSFPFAPRVEGKAKFCDSPCDPNYSTNFINSNDGSCSSNCLSNIRSEGNFRFCDLCPANTYSYDDGTCKSTCSSLMKQTPQAVYTLCQYPCPTGKFLYVGGECSSCPSPWIQGIQDGVDMCYHPCSVHSDYFYTKDNTCHASCPSPYQSFVKNSVKTCSTPCEADSTYLLPDGTCSSSCPSPMVARREGTAKFCEDKKSSWLDQYIGVVIAIIAYLTIHAVVLLYKQYKKYKEYQRPQDQENLQVTRVVSPPVSPDLVSPTSAASPAKSLKSIFNKSITTTLWDP